MPLQEAGVDEDGVSSFQGAGLELTTIPAKEKEKTLLEEQHNHLLHCLQKATVSTVSLLSLNMVGTS